MGTVRKGKRSELLMMAKLLEEGFHVFQELADEGGIDCGIFAPSGKFYPVQIKSRAEFGAGDLVSIDTFYPDMFVMIYDWGSGDFWVIPADEYQRMTSPADSRGRYRLTVNRKTKDLLEPFKGQKGMDVLKSRAV